jgi:hypothetical protein
MCDGLEMFLAERVLSTEPAHSALSILQHFPRLGGLPGEEVERLHVESS